MVKGYPLGTGEILRSLLETPMQTTVQLARRFDLSNHRTAMILNDLRETGKITQVARSFRLTWDGIQIVPKNGGKNASSRAAKES